MKHLATQGYIAIMTAIIVTVLVLVMVFTVSIGSFLGRANISSSYFKERSRAFAEACVETARFRLSTNANYTGGETVPVASSTCTIVSVVASR